MTIASEGESATNRYEITDNAILVAGRDDVIEFEGDTIKLLYHFDDNFDEYAIFKKKDVPKSMANTKWKLVRMVGDDYDYDVAAHFGDSINSYMIFSIDRVTFQTPNNNPDIVSYTYDDWYGYVDIQGNIFSVNGNKMVVNYNGTIMVYEKV